METVTHGQVLARPVPGSFSPCGRQPGELADLLGATRQNLSNLLACLRGCGLVVAIPEGRRTRYTSRPTPGMPSTTCSAWPWRSTRPP